LTYKNLEEGLKTDLKKIYSLLTVLIGLLGLVVPSWISNHLKKRKNFLTIDCVLLSMAYFITTISVFVYTMTIKWNVYASMFFYMVVIFGFNMGWVIEANILLEIIRPNLRSTANALMIFVLHLIGDSLSPYMVGTIADFCFKKSDYDNTITILLDCAQLSFYPIVYISFLACAFGLFASLSFVNDKLDKSNDLMDTE
jgi:MFS family permease